MLIGLNGIARCVDKDTEFFDGQCWKKICDYRDGDRVLQYHKETGIADLVNPIKFHKYDNSSFYLISNSTLNMALTSDHKVLYEVKGKRLTKTVDELYLQYYKGKYGVQAKIPQTFDLYLGSRGISLTDEELRIMVMVIADGYFPNGTNECRVNVKKQRKKDRVKFLLNAAKIPFLEYNHSDGYTRFTFKAPKYDKEFTSYYYNCSKSQRAIIVDEVFHWDGSFGGQGNTPTFYTTSKISADFVQMCIASLGHRANMREDVREGRNTTYEVSLSKRDGTTLHDKNKDISKLISKDSFIGTAYCFTVPSGFLVLRREGKIFVTGNCGKDTFGEMLAQELGYSTYALASPIKEFINELFGWDERMSDGVLKEEELYTACTNYVGLLKAFKGFNELLQTTTTLPPYANSYFADRFLEVFKDYFKRNDGVYQWYISPRKAYQLFGTEFGREIIKDSLWTDIAPKEGVIWTDVRFPNEANAICDNNGKIVRVLRPGQETIGESGHSSEAGIGDVEVFATIVNDGTLQDLRNKAKAIAAVLRSDDEQLSYTL